MAQITLANAKGIAFVDDDDFNKVSKHSWCLLKGGGNKQKEYAQANIKVDGTWKRIMLHRFVMNAVEGQKVDHMDGNGLNCRKLNLRFATRGQNQYNSGPRRGKYKGVSWHSQSRKWVAQITADNRHYYLGLFTDEVEAAKMYDEAAKRLHGEFARLNFLGNHNATPTVPAIGQ